MIEAKLFAGQILGVWESGFGGHNKTSCLFSFYFENIMENIIRAATHPRKKIIESNGFVDCCERNAKILEIQTLHFVTVFVEFN